MAQVRLSLIAVGDLDRLIRSHSLPHDTKVRLKRSIEVLETFPLLGPELHGPWHGFRFVLGPWRWMVVVYEYINDEDRVVIATIVDGRSSSFAG